MESQSPAVPSHTMTLSHIWIKKRVRALTETFMCASCFIMSSMAAWLVVEYEQVFRDMTNGAPTLPREQIIKFFHNCGYYPLEREVDAAFRSVFKGTLS